MKKLLGASLVIISLGFFIVPGEAQATPAFQAFSAIAAAANGGADPTVTLPTHAVNDILLLATVVRSNTATVATPAGWTQIGSATVRSTVATYQFFWLRAASGAETNPLIDRTGTTGDVYAAVITYRWAITTGDPWEVKGTVATGTTDPSTITGITTLTANALVVAAVAGEDDNNTSITSTGTNPSAYTEHYVESATGTGGVITFSEFARTTGGATGNVSVNWDTAVPIGFGGIVLALTPADPGARVVSGVYTGNGSDGRAISGLGFVPEFVIVKSAVAASQEAVFRTSTMIGDLSKQAASAAALTANWIQSFDSAGGGGFTVGTDARVNSSGVLYYWTAFRAAPGRMQVGTYLGTGVAGKTVTGVGFQPEVVFTMAETNTAAVALRTVAFTDTYYLTTDNGNSNGVTSLDADGFTVGSNSRANASGVTYDYIAFNEVADYMDVGTYSGTGAAPLYVNGVGFPPELVIVKSSTLTTRPVWHTDSLGAAVDSSLHFNNTTTGTNLITSLRTASPTDDGFSVGTDAAVNTSTNVLFYIAWKRESTPLIATGSYTGNAPTDNRAITEVGFAPDVVIVKGNTTQNAVILTSTMGVDAAKPMVGGTALTADLIQSLDAGGFTIGANAMVNSNTLTYHWIAFKAAAGAMKVGTYPGNNGSNPITGIGFSPELVFIMSPGSAEAVHRSSASTSAFNFSNSSGDATLITSLNSDGFTVATANTSVNATGTTYHYIAWNEIPGEMKVSTYTTPASPADDTNITGVGFEPEYVIVRNTGGENTVHHTGSLGRSTDESLFFTNVVDAVNEIQALQADGFQIGTALQVGEAVSTFVYYAWKRPDVDERTAVRLTAFSAARYDRGVLLQWRTGYEIDNLGFNLYREQNGVRTKVNASLVAGSGLLAGQGTAVNAEQAYARWDLDPAVLSDGVVYYLEDLDFNGTSTLHGPITPVAGALNAPAPPVTQSSDLNGLGKRTKGRKVFVEHGEDAERRDADRRTRRGWSAQPQSQTDTQWALAGQAAVKLGIRTPGWYRVTQAEVVAAGLDPRVNPRTLRLWVDGVEQAMRVTGEADGRFDAGDAIEFYATGVDTPYTDTRIYWLAAGRQRGQRIGAIGSGATHAAAGAAGPASFSSTLQQKERSIYFAALRNGDTENWFGSLVSPDPTDLSLPIRNLDRTGPVQLDVTLQGATSDPAMNPDHRVGVLVNGTEVGEMTFDGQANAVQTFALPVAVLLDGDNTIRLIARGGEADYSLVDVLRLSYWHTYRADADRLRFTVTTAGPVTIGGFATPTIRVVDITDPAAATELRGAVRAEAGGFSSVTVRVAGNGPRTLLAFSDATIASPAFVQANHPSTWHAASQAHDYVAIAHQNFLDHLTPLAALRAQQGYRTALVDVEDLYDEFSFGEKTPQALRDFLQWATAHWTQAPRFVVLVGDATIDPRDYAGLGDADFVPTKQVPMVTVALETASDDWFVDFNGDGLPDVPIGRLSVRTADQAEALVGKIVSYEQQSPQPWTKDVLLVADQNDAGSNFEQYSATLRALLPRDYTAHQVFRGALGGDVAHQTLVDRVNDGQLIVNYTGHGSVRIWGSDGELLTTDDVTAAWRNATRLPFVVAMNCLNGLFQGIWDEESLAESLQRAPNGGAVAVWASSSLTPAATQALVNQELFRLIFQGAYATLGEAVAAAKSVVSNPDLRRSWIFFGDPAMHLSGTPLPLTTRTQPSPTPVTTSTAAPSTAPSTQAAADAAAALAARPEPIRLADFTGEGRADVVVYAADSGRWAAAFNDVHGLTVRAGRWDPAWQVVAADLNGDGRADLVFYAPDTGAWAQALTTGTGTSSVTRGTLPGGATPNAHLQVGDFNGDHRDDLLIYDPDTGAWTLGLSERGGGFTARRGTWSVGLRLLVADFNGDGLADVFGYDPATTGRASVALTRRDAQFSVTTSDWGPGWRVSVATLDGNASADLVFYNPTSGRWLEAFNDGSGRFATRTGTWVPGLEVQTTDVDGDGRDDVFGYNPTTGEWLTALNVSTGRFVVTTGAWTPGWTVATGDVNGDGRGDVVLYDPVTGMGFQCVTVAPGIFAYGSGNWLPDASLIGRPR